MGINGKKQRYFSSFFGISSNVIIYISRSSFTFLIHGYSVSPNFLMEFSKKFFPNAFAVMIVNATLFPSVLGVPSMMNSSPKYCLTSRVVSRSLTALIWTRFHSARYGNGLSFSCLRLSFGSSNHISIFTCGSSASEYCVGSNSVPLYFLITYSTKLL